jgi:hypothetical protein
MKYLSSFWCLLFMASMHLSAQDLTPRQDGSVFSLEVGNLVFQVDSTYGAKVSSFTIDGSEFLVTPDMVSTDYLWGATLWPSPQKEWYWENPNKLVWDHGEYTVAIDGDTMRFTGKNVSVDNGDSFYFIKNFWANAADTTISLHYEMVNTSAKKIKKALWELSRVPVGGLTFWPTGPGGTWGELAPATEVMNGHTWYARESEDGVNLKFFADGKDGWYAHVDDLNRLYIKTFEDVDRSGFADGEGEIELWVADNEYIELENQSVCEFIDIGSRLEYEVRWYLRELPDHIEAIVGNMELVDFVKSVIEGDSLPPVSVSQSYVETLLVYPNPATNTIHVHLNGSGNESFQYSIINFLGETVKQGESTSEIIDISDVRRGMYLVQVRTDLGTTSRKILIE